MLSVQNVRELNIKVFLKFLELTDVTKWACCCQTRLKFYICQALSPLASKTETMLFCENNRTCDVFRVYTAVHHLAVALCSFTPLLLECAAMIRSLSRAIFRWNQTEERVPCYAAVCSDCVLTGKISRSTILMSTKLNILGKPLLFTSVSIKLIGINIGEIYILTWWLSR